MFSVGVGVVTSRTDLEEPLDASINEWYLFHGTSAAKCKSICSSNFRLSMAGTGATWKDGSKALGTPLYGFGVYLAERVTKADEYCEPLRSEDDQVQPILAQEGSEGE